MNIAALLAGLMSGIIGGMGLGGGAVLIIYLTIFQDVEQLQAQGINLLFFIPIAFLAVIIYAFKKQIKWRVTIPLAIGGIPFCIFLTRKLYTFSWFALSGALFIKTPHRTFIRFIIAQ